MGLCGKIIITSDKKNGVIRAANRIELICLEKKYKLDFTHYFQIELAWPEETVLEFKSKVLSLTGEKEFEKLQIIKNMHITLAMTTILSKQDEAKVCRLGKRVAEKFKSAVVSLRELEIMSDDYSDVKVLYLKVFDCEWVEKLSDQLKDGLIADDLPTDERKFKPHMTLVNQ